MSEDELDEESSESVTAEIDDDDVEEIEVEPEVEDDLGLLLAQAEAQRDDYLDALQRLKADFDNFRRRAARDQAQLATHAAERLVKDLLPVLDDLERALEAAAEHSEARLEDGVRLTHRALWDVLRREGLAEIPAEGQFDPHMHEALLSQPSDEEEGSVIEVLQRGYQLGDRVLRPARVVVATPKEKGEPAGDPDDEEDADEDRDEREKP